MRISDWSSDVCSSDLLGRGQREGRVEDLKVAVIGHAEHAAFGCPAELDRKSVVSGKSVTVRVDLGGRRIIKIKKLKNMIDCDSVLNCIRDIITANISAVYSVI